MPIYKGTKNNVDTFNHILNLIFIKERVLFVLGLGLWFLSKINIFVANLHLTYQSARLWHPPSLSYSAFFSYLFVSCLLRIQIQKQSYSFLDRIVSVYIFTSIYVMSKWVNQGHNSIRLNLPWVRELVSWFTYKYLIFIIYFIVQ